MICINEPLIRVNVMCNFKAEATIFCLLDGLVRVSLCSRKTEFLGTVVHWQIPNAQRL